MTQLQRFPSPAEAVAIDVLQLMRFFLWGQIVDLRSPIDQDEI